MKFTVFFLVALTVTTAHAASKSGPTGYVGWTDAAFLGETSGTGTYNNACEAQFGAGARWATANEAMQRAPQITNAGLTR